MASWYIAQSLETLRFQLNAMAPQRSKVSDGGIGDAAHSSRTSDHNPIDGTGQVCARDYTHDPAGGLDCHWLARQLTTNGDNRTKYVIWDRRIWTPGIGWKSYTGVNPHTKHLHLSVKAGAVGDQTRAWALGLTPGAGDDDMALSDEVKLWDGTTVTVGNLLAGLIGRIAPMYADLVEARPSLVKDSTYKAGVETYVRQVDARTFSMADRLAKLEAKQAEVLTKLSAILDIVQNPPETKG
jgi:hypothetical protein